MAKLRALIQKQVEKAFTKTLGDIPKRASYISIVSVYNPATAATTETRTTTAIKAVFTSDASRLALLSRLAARGSVDTVEGVSPTLFALVAGRQLTGITPKTGDVISCDGVEHTIESKEVDPVESLYKFGLRTP